MTASRESASSERRTTIQSLGPWFHNLHLPDGTQTAPGHELGDFPFFKWQQLASCLPEDLSGWTALDIGCNAGFYSFELAKRGAHVLGIDREPLYLKQARWAAREFGIERRVEFREVQVYDLARSAQSYDLVLFMGVFYHLRHPLLALDAIATMVKRMMVFQTLSMPEEEELEPPEDVSLDERTLLTHPGWPRMAFIERRMAKDLSNWWAPNRAAVRAMLRSSGLKVVNEPGHELYICEPTEDGDAERKAMVREELRAALGV